MLDFIVMQMEGLTVKRAIKIEKIQKLLESVLNQFLEILSSLLRFVGSRPQKS